MRWKLAALLCGALCLCAGATALASEEAQDLTAQCDFMIRHYQTPIRYFTDRSYETVAVSETIDDSFLQITLPEGSACGGLYIVWGDDVMPWHLLREEADGTWSVLHTGEAGGFLHQYIPLQGETARLRIVSDGEATRYLRIKELYVLGEGETPDWVQRWQPPAQKADLLVLSAHPDDEWIYMGGVIPSCVDAGKTVQVAYLTTADTRRRSELLDGLWLGGVRHYPDMTSGLSDRYTTSLADQYSYWPKGDVNRDVVTLYRRHRPDVVATHDANGEYGHGAHRVAADAAQKAVALAAGTENTAGLEAYGPWEIRKLYLHLYETGQMKMDWRVPLASFGGRTALEIARAAFAKHVSQDDGTWEVLDEGRHDNSVFGLAFSAVGPDVTGGDFFENLSETQEETGLVITVPEQDDIPMVIDSIE